MIDNQIIILRKMSLLWNFLNDIFWLQKGIKPFVTWCHHMVTGILVNIGSGNGLLPDGTKPLPESVLTYHQ